MTRIAGMGSAAVAVLIGLAACAFDRISGGTGAGNPPQADVALSFQASSSVTPAIAAEALARASAASFAHAAQGPTVRNPDGTFSVADSSGTPLKLTAISVKVGRIDFKLPVGLTCAQVVGLPCVDDEASVKGPYAMDLMSGQAVPSINFIKLPEGLYHDFGLEVPQGATDTGTNMFIRGEAELPGGKSPFELRLDLRDGVDFLDSAGVPISADAINRLVLSLGVDGWFAGVDVRRCLEDTSGAVVESGARILLGDTACGGTGLRIRRNIEASTDVENNEDAGNP